MASICRDPNGRRRVLFVAGDGSRKAVRLGRCSQKQAEAFRIKLEALVKGRYTAIDEETVRWVAGLPDDVHRKLVAVGLVEPRVAAPPAPDPEPEVLLGEFIDGYLRDRTDLKPNSQKVYGHTRRDLVTFFGADKPLEAITEYDAEQWQRYLGQQRLALATIRKRTMNAQTFFGVAIKQKLISSSPFEHLNSTSVTNKSREYFVTLEDTRKVLDACPDSQWRLIFALSRYGGLRCPSEILPLKWQDIDWGRGRFLAHSPKTEHHEGHESRWVPIFPELAPFLQQAFDEAEPGSEYVITRYRSKGVNLRTESHRIIRRAGLTPWVKTFVNLRSSRETELCERWPEHVVCAWIGNSKAVAREHYLQLRDSDFEKAARTPTEAAQKAAQLEAAETCDKPQTAGEPENTTSGILVETGVSGLSRVTARQANGADESRTHDLLHAMQALSQLSYGPK